MVSDFVDIKKTSEEMFVLLFTTVYVTYMFSNYLTTNKNPTEVTKSMTLYGWEKGQGLTRKSNVYKGHEV